MFTDFALETRLKQLFAYRELITLHWVLQTNWFVADCWNVMIGVGKEGRREGGSDRVGRENIRKEVGSEGATGGKILTRPLTLEHCTTLVVGADTEWVEQDGASQSWQPVVLGTELV